MLETYASIIGETYTGYISVDGGRCEIAGYPLVEIWSPLLRAAFLDFMEVATPHGLYVDMEGKNGLALVKRPLLAAPYLTLVKVDRDRPVRDWGFLYVGAGFDDFGDYMPRTVGGFPSGATAEGVCRNYEALLDTAKPAVCRISGTDASGATTMYDRLWLPIANMEEPVSAFLNIADVTLGITLPDGTVAGETSSRQRESRDPAESAEARDLPGGTRFR